MRILVLSVGVVLAASSVFAQQDTKAPGFFDRLFGTDEAENDEEQGSLLERLIEDQLSGAGRIVTVDGFSGALSGEATLERLSIADADGIWLTLEDATLDWSRGALFQGRLEVAELSADVITLPRLPAPADDQAPTPEASGGFSLPDLPVSINIGRIAADSVQIGAAVFGAEADVAIDGAMTLEGGEGSANLAIRRNDGGGGLDLNASYANATRNLALDLSLQEEADGLLVNLIDLPGRPSVDLTVKADAPLSDFTADLRLATDGSERLSGQVVLLETEGEQRISVDIGGDIAPVFAPDYRPFFGDNIQLRADARLPSDGRIIVPAFSLDAEAIALKGAVELGADRLPVIIDIEGEVSGERGRVLLPVGDDLQVSRIDLDIGFDAARSSDWSGDIVVSDLVQGAVVAERVSLSGTGRIVQGDTPEITAAFTFDTVGLETGIAGLAEALGRDLDGETQIDWRGGPVTISGLRLLAKAVEATGEAEISMAETGPEILGNVDVVADRVSDFSTLAGRNLSGAAKLATTFRVEPLAQVFDVRAQGETDDLAIDDPRADAILAGIADLDIQASRDQNGLRVEIENLSSAAADITGAADLRSGGSSLRLTARLNDTGILIERLDGPSTINLDGRENEERDWDLRAGLDGPTFEVGLNGQLANLFGLPEFAGQITANADELSVFSDLAGRPLRGRVSLEANGRLNADFSDLALTADVAGAGLAIGQADVDKVLAGEVTARIDATQKNGVVEVNELDLSTALLALQASGTLASRDTELAIRARLNEISSFVDGLAGPLSVDGTVARDGDDLRLDLSATGPGGAQADLAGTVAQDFGDADLSMRGSAPLGLANRFIQPRRIDGTASFDLRLAGAPAVQNVSGRVTTSGTRVTVPSVGLAFSNLSGDVTLGGGTANIDLGTNVEGGGRITLVGPVDLAGPNQADLSIRLNQIALSDPRLYETSVDGSVRVNGPLAGGARINGGLTLGQTDVRIPDSGFGGAGDVPEIIHLNEPPRVRGTRAKAGLLGGNGNGGGAAGGDGPSYPLDITVNAPNRIFVRGRGLDSEFGGGLRITGTTDNVIPQGAFELIRGRLDILGRRLLLEEARITLQGGFVPFLLLRASTDADGTQVNVIVEGPVDNPEITFTSAPELPQEEVLSRLIFGRGLETLSPLQAARLALAVRTLAGQGGEGIVGKIRNQTGLADLDVTTSEDGNAAVRAGAYLGENVYSDVTVDSTGETELNLNLDITPSLKARGGVKSTGDTSVGIFFERDY